MRHLRFLKRHEPHFRTAIYKAAEYCVIPPQTTVFRKGDPADYLYVILKGKVSVTKIFQDYDDIPQILNTLSDGDHFGELSVIDDNRLDASPTRGQGTDGPALKVRTRKATCRTVEETKVLKLECVAAQKLLQPKPDKSGDRRGSRARTPDLTEGSETSFTSGMDITP